MADDREKGTVKWFDTERGYGFVEREAGDDVFIHMTDVKRAGLETLFEGQHLTFVVETSAKGPQAAQLQPVDVQGARRIVSVGPPPSEPVDLEQVFYAAALHLCELESADPGRIPLYGESTLADVDPQWRINMDIVGPYDDESRQEFLDRKLEILDKLAEVSGLKIASQNLIKHLRELRG